MALPVTTLVPFASLPSCASSCGPLYDANGACVPPATTSAAPSVYDACFCSFHALQPFYSGSTGVCQSDACTGTDSTNLGSIADWFTSFCAQAGIAAPTTTDSGSDAGGTGSPSSSDESGGGGTWLSTHYQWVIMLVVLVVLIVGGWIGAAMWRKRYLAKRDRQYALGKQLATQTGSGRVVPNNGVSNINVPGAGMFQPAPISAAGVYDDEKLARRPQKEKKKWVPTERT